MEKASNSQAIKDAIGEPIVKGPWYNASLAVAHKRQSVSCTFPVSGPHGNGVFQLKAVRNGGLCISDLLFFLLQSLCLICTLSFSYLPSLSYNAQRLDLHICNPCSDMYIIASFSLLIL
jgi:hypothetical protein